MTVMVALAHAFRRNPKFDPDLLYVGTFILDAVWVGAIQF